jgi:hypothetical protein
VFSDSWPSPAQSYLVPSPAGLMTLGVLQLPQSEVVFETPRYEPWCSRHPTLSRKDINMGALRTVQFA